MAPDANPFTRLMNAIISNTWALVGGALALVLLLVLMLVWRNKSNIDPDEVDQVENQILGDESDSDELLFSGVAAAAAAADDERQALDDKPSEAGFAAESEIDGFSDADDEFAEEMLVMEQLAEQDAPEDDLGIETGAHAFDLKETALAETAAEEPVAEEPAEPSEFPAHSDDFDIAEPDDDTEAFDTAWPTADTSSGSVPANEGADEVTDHEPAAEDVFSDIMDDEFSWTENDGSATELAPGSAATTSAEESQPGSPEFDISETDDEVEFEDLAFPTPEDSFGDDAEDAGDEDGQAFLSGSDEAATKLDLARAYVDMGDADGAREILNEVLQEGSEPQRRDAQSLLDRISA